MLGFVYVNEKKYNDVMKNLRFADGRDCLDGLCCFPSRGALEDMGVGNNPTIGLTRILKKEVLKDWAALKIVDFAALLKNGHYYACQHLEPNVEDSNLAFRCRIYEKRPEKCREYEKKNCAARIVLTDKMGCKPPEIEYFYAFQRGTAAEFEEFFVGWLMNWQGFYDLVPVPDNIKPPDMIPK